MRLKALRLKAQSEIQCPVQMDLFNVAKRWDKIHDSERNGLRSLITQLVGYSCKLACQPNDFGGVDIFVFSISAGAIMDWIEIQPTGALGVIWGEYVDEGASALRRLDRACRAYNAQYGLAYEECEDSTDASSTEDEAEDEGEGEDGEIKEEESSSDDE